MIPGKTYTPQDVLNAAWRRRWWIATPFFLLSSVAFLFVMSLTYNYRSLATIRVLPDPASDAFVRTAVQPSVADRLSSIGQETLTRTRLEQIIADFDLYPEMRRSTVMENVIFRMRADITFQPTDRDLFTLGFTARDPQTALAVASRLTALFLEENAQARGKRADAATNFLENQLQDARTKLVEQEQRIDTFRATYTGELPSQLTANVSELNNTQQQLRTLVESIGRDRDQRLFLQRQLELARPADDGSRATSTGGSRPGSAGQAGSEADELAAARANLRALELRLTPEHPDVQRAKRTVATLDQKTTMTAGAGSPGPVRRLDPRTQEITGQVELLDRQIASRLEDERQLRARINDYKRRVDVTPLRESEFSALSRDYEDTKRQYSSLAQRQQDASVAANMERKEIGDRFRVIDPARLPEKPFSPSRRNNFAIGLLMALGISLSLAAIAEYRDSSFRSDDEVTRSVRLPVLATIPLLNETSHRGVK